MYGSPITQRIHSLKTRKSYHFLAICLLYTLSGLGQSNPPYQSVVNAGGSTYSTENYSFEWNIGEMSGIQTIGVRSLLITEGFLQPMTNNIFGVGYNSRLEFFNTKAFPNPAKNEFYLQFRVPGYGKASISFSDVAGRILFTQPIYLSGQLIEKISIAQLPAGQYYATITYNVKGIFTSRKDVFEITKL